MHRNISRSIIVFLIVFACLNSSFARDKKAKILIIGTLHQYHAQMDYYSFETLARIIEKQKPDILAVELTPADLQSRREQKIKQEYARSVFPVADKNKYLLVPLEPAEPKFTEIVSLVRDSEKSLREKSPEKAEAFSLYNKGLFDYLFKHWKSPADVNSSQTDVLLEIKHNFQNDLFGEKQERGWEMWNRHFLETILSTAQKYPGKKIAVIVGVEHAYWLKKHLAANKEIDLLDTERALKQ
jgi:hypothetical protein